MDIENFQEKHDQLWDRAWTLADKIDDHQGGIPVEIRRRMLPELNRLRAELVKLEQAGAHPPGNKIEPVKQPEIPTGEKTNPDVCPAKCKLSGKCYSKAYFLGKSGKSQNCIKPCPFSDQFETFFKNKRDSKK